MENIRFYADKLYISDCLWRQRIEEAGYQHIEKTFFNMRGMAKNHIIPLFGDYYPGVLRPRIIRDALRMLSLSGGTKNKIVRCLSNIYRYLIEEDIVKENPATAIIRYSAKIKNERGIIPDNEIEKLFPDRHEARLKIWKTQRYLCAFMVLRDTGMRPGELAALRWSDWYPEELFFPIVKAIEAGTKNKIKSTKTGNCRPALVEHETAIEMELLRKMAKQNTEHFIFAGIKNNVPYDSHRLCFTLRRALVNAEIDRPEYTTYWFRHTFNTKALVKYPADKVRRLMGHVTEAMTRNYRHPDIEILKKEAKAIRNNRPDDGGVAPRRNRPLPVGES